jgi:hypothetical protein
MKSKPLKTFGFRADESKMEQAHALGVDVGEMFRKALDYEILRKSNEPCPTCGGARDVVINRCNSLSNSFFNFTTATKKAGKRSKR